MKFVLTLMLFHTCLVHASSVDRPFLGAIEGVNTGNVYAARGEHSPPVNLLFGDEINKVLFSEAREQNQDLKRVKFYLMNGETRLAKLYLSKLSYTETKLKPISFRYLGILAFIEGDFTKSLGYLSRPELDSLPHYSKICTLKVLNRIVLNKVYALGDEWSRCKEESYLHFKTENLIWMETLVQLKLNPKPGIASAPFKGAKLAALEGSELKMLLKLALYLNQESLIEPQITELALDQLHDPEVRELTGQILFRLGKLAKSYRYIEDLKSPNAENIKGNLYLLRNKYELAYAQFKLALEQKQNSQNAMERLLPLAWLLGDWEEGSKYAERVIASPQTQISKLTLIAAFLTQKGDFQKAQEILNYIVGRSRLGNELDVTQLYSFVGLMQNNPDVAAKQASLSCTQNDLVNCWLMFQLSQWDAFPLTIKRQDKPVAKRSWEKLVKEDVDQPLKETVYVNQLDIEEMDDRLIQLIPHGP